MLARSLSVLYSRAHCDSSEDKRKILLTSPGVFGVFCAYKFKASASVQAMDAKKGVAEVKALIDRHADVAVDAYLCRGLCNDADYLLRIHATDLAATQRFLLEFDDTLYGSSSTQTSVLVGVTKPLKYITKAMLPDLNTTLLSSSYSNLAPPPKYAVVIPIKKSADWWTRDETARRSDMETHTRDTIPAVAYTNRKLYHATGLTSDADFITYFETADLAAFNDLCVTLMQVPENKYHSRWGSTVILGTLQPVENIFGL